jgi:putative FmdB family regulatory protein
MPTYEYACRSCGEHLEVVQSFRDEPLTECPHCRGALRKVFSPVGISFKGSGFYSTDSRAAARKGDAKRDKPETSKAEGSSTGSESTSKETGAGKADTTKADTTKKDAKTQAKSA